jgi:hypothetical protein
MTDYIDWEDLRKEIAEEIGPESIAAARAELFARVMNARKEGRKDTEAEEELMKRAVERNKDALRRLGE